MMQTFLPYADFRASAAVLDRARLGKQRLETKQILSALRGQKSGWSNHPATKMWIGHDGALVEYGLTICLEWINRGYNDAMRFEFLDIYKEVDPKTRAKPAWFGDHAFHASHRSNLLRKDPDHYRQFGWTESTTLPYIWPV
jgi:hypothetical protein